MKKIVIVGGSSGIGLAIAKCLVSEGNEVIVVDKNEPDKTVQFDNASFSYIKTDLIDFNEQLFEELAKDEEIDGLIISAGFGRVTAFDNISVKEIGDMMAVNATACIKIIRLFYERINSEKPFYTAVMGSIAGIVSSPLFSVYAASKAALCRFVESVNIELEVNRISNRILNVSPGSIKGTKFNGGANDLTETIGLAKEVIHRMERNETIYIPRYEEVFKGVIEQYHNDPHKYGLHSYNYKLKSDRMR